MVEQVSIVEAVRVPHGFSISDIADRLQVEITPTRDPHSELQSAIPAEEREAIGYGDLDDMLIRRVKLEIAFLTPDQMAGDLSRQRLAAQTMRIIQQAHEQGGDVTTDELWARLDPEAAGIMPGDSIYTADLGTLASAVAVTEHLSRTYFNSEGKENGYGDSN